MKAFECVIACRSGRTIRAIVLCEGKDQIPPLADMGAFPEDAIGIDEAHEIEFPAAYVLADQS